MRGLLFINPRSRSGVERKAEAVRELSAQGIEVIDVSDVRPERLAAADRPGDERADLIVVGGGDGTINRVLEMLVDLQLPVGILPLGTANDLAATLGIPGNLKEACALIAGGHTRRIDLGWVNGKHFVNEGSLGVSNLIVSHLDPITKKRWGMCGILARTARVVSRARRFRAWLRCDDEVHEVSTLQVTVGNGERFGGFIRVSEADISDHRLDLYSLEVNSFAQVMSLMPALVRGRYAGLPGVRLQRASEIEVRTRRPRHVYTDGEPATVTPALFRLKASALTVFCAPPGSNG